MTEPQSSPDELAYRATIIQKAIIYSRRFRGGWFIVHTDSRSVEAVTLCHDLQLLLALGIHVAVVVAEGDDTESQAYADELRFALNLEDLSAVVLHWAETRTTEVSERLRRRRWQELAENSALIVIVRCPKSESLAAARTLGVESAAAKLLLLDRDWKPEHLSVGGPGAPRPSAVQVVPLMRTMTNGAPLVATAIAAVEAGIEEAHIIPTSDNPHPILVEIFTDEGVGTWIGS